MFWIGFADRGARFISTCVRPQRVANPSVNIDSNMMYRQACGAKSHEMHPKRTMVGIGSVAHHPLELNSDKKRGILIWRGVLSIAGRDFPARQVPNSTHSLSFEPTADRCLVAVRCRLSLRLALAGRLCFFPLTRSPRIGAIPFLGSPFDDCTSEKLRVANLRSPGTLVFSSSCPESNATAQLAFARVPAEARENLVQEAVVSSMLAYVRLYERGRTAVAFASVLVKYAVAQIRDGRRVGSKLNNRDVTSPYAQKQRPITIERLDRFDREEGVWLEAVVEDHHTPVIDQAAFRLDFPQWLSTFNRRDRKIAELLAAGHNTGDVARRFGLSAGRISQKRREYAESWRRFHGEPPCLQSTQKAA